MSIWYVHSAHNMLVVKNSQQCQWSKQIISKFCWQVHGRIARIYVQKHKMQAVEISEGDSKPSPSHWQVSTTLKLWCKMILALTTIRCHNQTACPHSFVQESIQTFILWFLQAQGNQIYLILIQKVMVLKLQNLSCPQIIIQSHPKKIPKRTAAPFFWLLENPCCAYLQHLQTFKLTHNFIAEWQFEDRRAKQSKQASVFTTSKFTIRTNSMI